MTWGRSHVRTTEWVLEELYQTGRQWMTESARRKRYAPITTPVMAPREDGPPAEPEPDPGSTDDSELRERFEQLYAEFIQRIDSR